MSNENNGIPSFEVYDELGYNELQNAAGVGMEVSAYRKVNNVYQKISSEERPIDLAAFLVRLWWLGAGGKIVSPALLRPLKEIDLLRIHSWSIQNLPGPNTARWLEVLERGFIPSSADSEFNVLYYKPKSISVIFDQATE